jgi:hypothetical protein
VHDGEVLDDIFGEARLVAAGGGGAQAGQGAALADFPPHLGRRPVVAFGVGLARRTGDFTQIFPALKPEHLA